MGSSQAGALNASERQELIALRRKLSQIQMERDILAKTCAPGLRTGRRGCGRQLTQPGPLAALMPLALKELNQSKIEAAATTIKARPVHRQPASHGDY